MSLFAGPFEDPVVVVVVRDQGLQDRSPGTLSTQNIAFEISFPYSTSG